MHSRHALCPGNVFFVVGVLRPMYAARLWGLQVAHLFRNERGAALLILGDASYCFVDDCAVGLVMHSSEPEQLHSVMHLRASNGKLFNKIAASWSC